jgi:uncharacterized protein YodC (DUF2158 family)
MTNKIEKGSVVKLKSDNQKMTVNFVENDNGVEVAACTWLYKGEQKGGRFPVTSLDLVSE